ncbi:metallophosphoesterase family protein [Streptomyces millisiae]|uniref:Metallophosphoesterase family protein n=1 Tax=Streptomyces millisiae TaxID=3075542 RepID=A0ABU2LJZ1_9ACTN|nr:metallophosphoesterase family protein [Streptomyces sp. DSM 44918]MDT0317904.1 metallophosphoesterase family protein [Streptomyces sp. DSM 44918]
MRSTRAKVAVLGTATLAVSGLLASPMAFSDSPTPPTEYPAAEIHRPSPMPDRVLLTPTTAPATSQNVTWRADAPNGSAQAQILAAPRALGDVQPAEGAVTTVLAAASTPVNTDLGYASTYHTVNFTDLEPNTRYSYRVGDGVNWSEWVDFTTAADELEPFSFIYYGDAQNYIDSAVPRVFRQAFADRPDARLIINAGDLVNSPNSEEEWGQWHQADGFIDGQVNNVSVPGNHEYGSGRLSSFWRPQFPYPDNGPGTPETNGTAYTVDYQGVRFIALDSNLQNNATVMAAQTEWLAGLLRDNPNRWTVVTFHHPVYSMTGTRNNTNVRAQWGPLFEEYGVDLVLQGHDHSYGRGNRADARQSVTVHNGVTYAVSVSGGKMYDLNNGENWTGNGGEIVSDGQDAQLYQLIDVTEDTIQYEARYANGEHHDGFLIRKNDEGERTVNEIRTPENTVGEQVTVDRTSARPGDRVEVSAYGYDPDERVTVRFRRDGDDGDGSSLGTVRADELGRVSGTVQIPRSARRDTAYELYLTSENQRIDSPSITVTR